MAGKSDITERLLALWHDGKQIAPFSEADPEFSMDEAYTIAADIRQRRIARGEKPAGRKIGFTNSAIWKDYGIAAPIWACIYDTTVHSIAGRNMFALGTIPEPRIEPELVLHLARRPEPGMGNVELAACIDWIAPGFEIVFSPFRGWRFAAADAAAAFGVHRALFVGPMLKFEGALPEFRVELLGNDGLVRHGHSRDVLGGPLEALNFLHEELQHRPGQPLLEAGELITTGTLTEAMPARPGDSWTMRTTGLECPDITLQLV